MTKAISARIFLLSTVLLGAGWGVLCQFAPWRQVHPSDASLGHALSRAALWSHTYDGLPGAQIDGAEFLLEAGVILFMCLLLLGFFRSLRLSVR